MLRNIRMMLIAFIVAILISGCQNDDVTIFQFKDATVGNNSAVTSIVQQLPGGEHIHMYQLETKEEPYGIILDFEWKDSEAAYKEMIVHQATYLFSLVQQVEWITFTSERGDYTITKEQVDNWYDTDVKTFQNEDEIKERIQQLLEDRHINGFVL